MHSQQETFVASHLIILILQQTNSNNQYCFALSIILHTKCRFSGACACVSGPNGGGKRVSRYASFMQMSHFYEVCVKKRAPITKILLLGNKYVVCIFIVL